MDRARTKSNSLTNIVAYALIGCIAFVVMKFEFPIMPGISFLKFDFSDVIITIGMFYFRSNSRNHYCIDQNDLKFDL